jgi:hypothetical protein
MNGWKSAIALSLTVGLMAALVGCGSSDSAVNAPGAKPMPKDVEKSVETNAVAGMPIPETADPAFAETRKVAEERPFAVRGNAFALLSPEVKFNREQTSERIFSNLGGFQVEYEPPLEKPDPEEQREPQPYRRLAGIVLGDAVLALIEMEDGQTYQVRPGQQIPNSEWFVFSIDAEKAILRRKGNKIPHEIAVALESRRGGSGGGGGAPTGGSPSGGAADNPGNSMTPGASGATGGAGGPGSSKSD